LVGRARATADGVTRKSLRSQLGKPILGCACRLGPDRSLKVSFGVGATRGTQIAGDN
jgi:hypothetical protein